MCYYKSISMFRLGMRKLLTDLLPLTSLVWVSPQLLVAAGHDCVPLNLHLDVEKPGMFCCDDGTCITSSLVCNDFYDCEDRSDETNCTIMTLQEHHFNKNKPPVHFKDGKKDPLPVKASIKIYKVFDINESESSFDIFFKLLLEWNDKNLR